jgi:hypothetical protein
MGTPSQEKQAYHPAVSWLMVSVLGMPSSGRDQCTALHPSLESTWRAPGSRCRVWRRSQRACRCMRCSVWHRGSANSPVSHHS